MRFEFSKLNGCGNSFIVIDDRARHFPVSKPQIRKLCSAQFGIGSDGLILLQPSKRADFKMAYFDRDGSRPEMCGNGIRCLAKFIFDRKISGKRQLLIETKAGVITTEIFGKAKARVNLVRVDMGKPALASRDFKGKPGRDFSVAGFKAFFVSMGNPHAIIFGREVVSDVQKKGEAVQAVRRIFPRSVNVEFVKVVSKKKLRMRVWERGAGLTLACGTGACASVVAARLKGLVGAGGIAVIVDGGELKIEWNERENTVYMSGPAEVVAEGVLPENLHSDFKL